MNFFLLACLLALHALCGYFIRPYTLFPQLSLLLPSMFTPAYFHHRHLLPLACSHLLLPSPPTPTYLFPPTCSHLLLPLLPTFAITTYSSISLSSTYFIAYFRHRPLFSLACTIIAYSHLLPPLPPTCSRHRHLLPPTSTIATYLFLPSLPTPTYFHHCRLFRYLTYFYLLRRLLAYPCC
jgi:hypothetical protein